MERAMACAGLVQGMRDYFERRQSALPDGPSTVPDFATLLAQAKPWDERDWDRIRTYMRDYMGADTNVVA